MSKVRDLLAKSISTVYQELFYHLAESAARRSVRVRAIGDQTNIFRPDRMELIRIGRRNAVYIVNFINQFDDFFAAVGSVQIIFHGQLFAMVDFSSPRLHNVTGFKDFPVLCPSLTEAFTPNRECIDFANLQNGQIAIDLGSYNGLTSIAFAKEAGITGRVIALEPDPLNFTCAAANIAVHKRLSGADNIILIPAAAAPSNGVLQLSSEGATGSALRSIVGGYRGKGRRRRGSDLADDCRPAQSRVR